MNPVGFVQICEVWSEGESVGVGFTKENFRISGRKIMTPLPMSRRTVEERVSNG